MVQKYKATFIGLCFTISGMLLYYTFIIPLLIMMPLALPLEMVLQAVNPGSGYYFVGHGVIITLTVLFVIISAIFFRKFLQQIKFLEGYKTLPIIAYMILLQFIVHPLVFYIHLSKDWSSASDGQFFMSLNETFQLSSLTFLFIGILLDYLKFFRLKHKQKYFDNENDLAV